MLLLIICFEEVSKLLDFEFLACFSNERRCFLLQFHFKQPCVALYQLQYFCFDKIFLNQGFCEMKKEESIYFSGSMLFISAQTQRLQDINLLKSLIQFHLDTDAKFWLEDHNAFLKDLLQKKQKEGSPVPSPASAGKAVVLRSAPENVPPKRLSIQQTSVESFDFAGPLSARADTQPLCADCAKLKQGGGRVKVLVQLFNKIANQKVTEKYRGATKSLRKRSAHGKSRVFRFSPEYFRRHNRNSNKKVNLMICVEVNICTLIYNSNKYVLLLLMTV